MALWNTRICRRSVISACAAAVGEEAWPLFAVLSTPGGRNGGGNNGPAPIPDLQESSEKRTSPARSRSPIARMVIL